MEIRKFSSKLGVIVLSIVLLTGISLVPTLQIGVEGRGQPNRLTTPTTSPTPTTPPTSTATTSFTTPQPPRSAPPVTTTTITTPPPPVTTTTARITPAPTDTVTPTPTTDAADGAANQTAMVMIPLSTIQMIMSQVQDAMTAVNSDNKTGAMTTLNSVDQELKSAVDATGVSVEATTNVDDGGGSGDNK
jgi:cytoskeletal protein RodZ